MATARRIAKVWKSQPTEEGAGVHLKRGFGHAEVPRLDPFLMLDDFHSDDPEKYLPGFPWHPHRGIETISYVLEGRVEHGDSMGNRGVIGAGDVQWMTAGSGIIHQEMPKGGRGNLLWGFQLWANLPGKSKMMDPRYREVKSETIPEVRLDSGARVRVVAGRVGGVAGPVRDIVTAPELLDVAVPAGATFRHAVADGHTVFAYVIEGRAWFDEAHDPYGHDAGSARWSNLKRECSFDAETVVLYERSGGDVVVTPGDGPVRFLLASGRPLGEPVAWYGPIVMNTQEELRTAFREYEEGTFIKRKS